MTDPVKSRMGKRNRRAGHDYERKIAKEMRALGWVSAITSRYGSREKDDKKVDIMNVDPFNIQCKSVQRPVKYIALLDEMPNDFNFNVIFHKLLHKGEYVILKKEDFYTLIKKT
jgi:hypothetical protein